MATWRYLACDLLTDEPIEELPLSGVRFGLTMNAPGSFSATLKLGQQAHTSATVLASSDQFYLNATEPARTVLWVLRDGVVVWGGILWDRDYDSSSRALALSGASFESYLWHRRMDYTASYDADQLDIIRDLINNMALRDGGDIGIEADWDERPLNTPFSGVQRQRTYFYYEQKQIGESVQQLGAVEDGFDWAIDVSGDMATRRKILNCSYPRRGRSVTDSGLVFETSRNLLTYKVADKGSTVVNRSFGAGAGEGEAMLTSTASRTEAIDAGFPLLDGVVSHKAVSVQATLDGYTRDQVDSYYVPPQFLTINVKGDRDPVIGSWVIGDDARIIIKPDARFPSGLMANYRIMTADVTPGDAGEEIVSLTLVAA